MLVSHTGVRGTCDRSRNLSDDQLRAIASTGGLVGIGFWSGAVCGTTVTDIAKAIAYAVRLVGAGHVALGSDFDGDAVAIDPTGLALLASELQSQGLDAQEVEAVFGGNVIRFLLAHLPASR